MYAVRMPRADSVCEPSVYRRLAALAGPCATHWAPFLSDPVALQQKLRRSSYVLGQLEGARRIIDYGSGLGLLTCYMAQYVDQVVGVEIIPEWRATSEQLARDVFRVENVSFLESDDSLAPGSFDAVVMSNSVSHVAHLAAVLVRIAEVLRTGGILFVEDNNNRRSVIVRHRQRRLWATAEEGFANVRAELDPGREDETYGLSQDEILAWRGRDLSPLRRLREFAPRSPRDGSYHENWFTPRELELLLFHAGFAPLHHRAKYVFDFKTSLFASFASHVFKTFPHLSLLIAPAYEVTVVKT
jgi:SAM-dependent methyltransferase